MMAFDAPSREVCTARREVTSTPLQSLVLMNDPQFVEAARVLAASVWGQANENARLAIQLMFRKLLTREPDPGELDILERLFAGNRKTFADDPAASDELLAVGEHPLTPEEESAEVAAMATVASVLMNYDEFVVKR
jgi:hypothetical protein